jgi:hypothetical protein
MPMARRQHTWLWRQFERPVTLAPPSRVSTVIYLLDYLSDSELNTRYIFERWSVCLVRYILHLLTVNGKIPDRYRTGSISLAKLGTPLKSVALAPRSFRLFLDRCPILKNLVTSRVSTEFRRYGTSPEFFYFRTSDLPSELTFNSWGLHEIPNGRVSRISGEFRNIPCTVLLIWNSEFLGSLQSDIWTST